MRVAHFPLVADSKYSWAVTAQAWAALAGSIAVEE
jgi:hypothetical protein